MQTLKFFFLTNADHLLGTNGRAPGQTGFLSFFHTPETPVPSIPVLSTGPITLAFILFFLLSLQSHLFQDSHSRHPVDQVLLLADFCGGLPCLSPIHYPEITHQSTSTSLSVLSQENSLSGWRCRPLHTFTLVRSDTLSISEECQEIENSPLKQGALMWAGLCVGGRVP